MYLIILAGEGVKNRAWAEEIKKTLKTHPIDPTVFYYKHWDIVEGSMDIEEEESRLTDFLEKLDNYVFFAKSAGVILAMKSIANGNVNPTKCIFVGTAFNWAKSNNYPIEQWITNFPIETLFIQNERDPALHFAELNAMASKNTLAKNKLIKLPGDSHDYAAEVVTELTERFLLEK